ncbi:protein of unknown function UPF0153 [Desulfovibrio sp. X2]|uniref:YkgJ family cysteine cluster protein n=1 Tax=Desulfovibrio sp. X2 TaxID=941449 RepID=UPI0003587425|nr:YkgJ family cysteine cluster protein [Desulfovibrio sp. X2]EPR40836.1 protein of unknown function UPF0153 [Desulfovibrio sp. X2]
MGIDLSPYFAEYEALVAEVDKLFATVRGQCGDLVTCKQGCDDCCHALFDLSLIEGAYLNDRFNKAFSGRERDAVLMRADAAERLQHKIVRQAFRAKESGEDTMVVLRQLAAERVRCPLLTEESACAGYDYRPITCRLYGIPTAFEGQTRTCGLSGFEAGKPYPTVQLEKIQDRLVELSQRVAEDLGSSFSGLATLFVPVSVALMNTYDEEYLGLKKDGEGEEIAGLAPDELPGAAPADKPTGPADAATYVPGKRIDFPTEECGECGESDCSGCAQAASGGCKGKPYVLEVKGPGEGGKS